MSARSARSGYDERLDLLDALIYADAFDCALTSDELWRYCRAPIDRRALARRLQDDPCMRALVLAREGLYCFKDRPDLIERRPSRIARARRLQRRGRRVARVLRHVPFVRGLALTGSAAADDAADGADVDLIVAVAPGRLATVFFLLGSASRVLGRGLFCPNYYIREDRLKMPPSDVYVARELAQARSLEGESAALWKSNPWLAEIFPNAVPSPDEGSARGWRTALQVVLEAPLRRRLGDRLERRAGRLALARLGVHYGGAREQVPPEVIQGLEAGTHLRFHRGKIHAATVQRYSARREQIAARLRALAEERDPAAGPRR